MPESKKTVLILDGEQRSSLAVTRALGKHNILVYVASSSLASLAGASKYCYQQVKYCNPRADVSKFIYDINEIIVRNGIEIIFPISDLTSFSLLKNQTKLSKSVLIAAPSFKQYSAASDKVYLTTSLAIVNNVPVPKSTTISNAEEWTDLACQLQFPVIFKPRSSIMEVDGQLYSTAVRIVVDLQAGLNLIEHDIGFSKLFLVQERINGEGIGVFVMSYNGIPKIFVSHRRIREKPPWGGVSVLCESTEPSEDIKEYAMRLLRGLKFNGVAMVEFKRDSETGIPYLMEINARFWGSLQLAVSAGIDFPSLLYKHTCGKPFTALAGKICQSRLRWLLGDFDSLIISLRSRGQFVPGKRFSKGLLIKDFLFEFFRRPTYQVFWWSDLKPFFHEFREYCKVFIRR